MLERIHIENFKSLKDVTLDLQQVNLLIGPNNSGKSNLLKALEFFSTRVHQFIDEKSSDYSFKKKGGLIKLKLIENKNIIHELKFNYFEKILRLPMKYIIDEDEYEDKYILLSKGLFNNPDANFSEYREEVLGLFIIYSPRPNSFVEPSNLSDEQFINSTCSNLIPFLFNLSQNNKKLFTELERKLNQCVKDFVSISTPIVNTKEGNKLGLKFFDKDDNPYWAEEVSEGVLYFLALLCIIHQPNPPKLLLLEEPERGIHPRRIKEVIDFIFTLAQEKGIQVIMTSHHPYILEEFKDIPESVFIFDKDEEGATQIKNLKKDIIDPSDAENDKRGLPRIKFTQDLADHWFSGFLGGVPV